MTLSVPQSPSLLNFILDAVCVVNEDGVFLSVTGACEQIFGYIPEELVGRQMLKLVYEPDRPRTLAAVANLMNGHLQYDFENRYVRKDGGIVYLMWSARWYKEKKIRVAVARDITRQKIRKGVSAIEGSEEVSAYWRLSSAPPCLIPPNSAPILLSNQDYVVLAALAASSKPVSRKAIVAALGQDYMSYDRRRLDTQIRRLRRKVESASGLRLPVATLRGVGYRFYDRIEFK